MVEPIAIVGSACRFPGSSNSPSQLWDLLKAPRDVLREFPAYRLNLAKFHSQNGEQPGCTDVGNQAYLLEQDPRLFDAAFFRINSQEAHAADPQQRILLETVYEALESAGWSLARVEGSLTSVHVGVMTSDYVRDLNSFPTYAATGMARSMLANRVSYFFDLKGPSVSIDTACSSSLVALHQAVQGIRNGDATQAIVAGSALLLDPAMFVAESSLHMLSPDSCSRMWDKDANGYARGEGCAAIVLKSLSKALEDNDDIECIIREVAVNSDGRTNGITQPNYAAQAELIRKTYEKVGLDPVKDRCQYFECHGTGTLAGDPIEARAVKEAFFPDGCSLTDNHDPLYCGSIKTVIGHLEGCAGLAGVLKASLALQHAVIPPNMHFNQLHSSIVPYYDNLCVPQSIIPWPCAANGVRRASVNSFGFGGTNAHIILEHYQSNTDTDGRTANKAPDNSPLGPFVFSARSQSSLVSLLRRIATHIRQNASLDLHALSWVLHTRRSIFPLRVALAGSDRDQLLINLDKTLALAKEFSDTEFGVRAAALSPEQRPRVLGVFTGQGAQWATMGRELMRYCPLFRRSLEACEQILKGLPDGPSWSLIHELTSESTESRISQAAICQPLCAAIQIALVDVLRASSVRFDGVVGHSSGEIGAAYAAGILTARDALGIAYYRGLVACLASSKYGKQGGMMAVAMSFEDAEAFCAQPRFTEKIGIAASNSPSSVTLSGDLDAIYLAKSTIDRDGTFARLLKVDIAYHSHHMALCAEAYLTYLKQLGVHPQPPREGCTWYSSVLSYQRPLEPSLEELTGQYWVDNMTRPVMFSEALKSIFLHTGPFSTAIEVGPHPALQGPVSQTIKHITDVPLPYVGCLRRGENDVESMSAALGFLWCHLGPAGVDLEGWRTSACEGGRPHMLKNLPSYAWDHNQIYWNESRLSRDCRLGPHPRHELLGRLQQHNPGETTWRNVFRQDDLPWIRGHKFQGQVIFPGAGYVSMAAQAAQILAPEQTVKMIEIHEMEIIKALVIGEDGESVETVFTMKSEDQYYGSIQNSVWEGYFTCFTCSGGTDLAKTCAGRLVVHFGEPTPEQFPPMVICKDELPPLHLERFFAATSGMGLDYDGVFRALDSINRIWGIAQASASWGNNGLFNGYIIHPAVLDVAFQAGLATVLSIADKAMTTAYLPSKIRRIVIDPAQQYQGLSHNTITGMDANLVESNDTSIEVDINIYHEASKSFGVQIDGLVLKAIGKPQTSDDRLIFAKTIWEVDAAGSLPIASLGEIAEDHLEYIDAVERTALFFLQSLCREIRPEERPTLKWHHQALLRGIDSLLEPVRQGRHAVLKKEWLLDDWETIQAIAQHFPESVDIALLASVGENLASVMRGESEMLEHMLRGDLLSRFYTNGRGMASCNDQAASFMHAISHKYPRTNILEIGAGSGGATASILKRIGTAYLSYTYTDISPAFFEKASELFADHLDRLKFKTLDIEVAPEKQGFMPASYDVIIASNVLHATRSLSRTMNHARTLLRPGGFLIAVEVTGTSLRETGLMGGLEGWWLGEDDGRFPGPCISAMDWDNVLRDKGFSGIDSIFYDFPDLQRHNCSAFITRAMDAQFALLSDPRNLVIPNLDSRVLVIGGQTLTSSKAVRQAQCLLERWTPNVTVCTSIEALDSSAIMSNTSILCLAELDHPIFSKNLTFQVLENLQRLLGNASNVLWVTTGRLSNDPYSNMMIGIGRALAHELPHIQIQFMDFDQQSSWDMDMVVQYLIRMSLLSRPEFQGHNMLWVQEPEVTITGRTTLIPRVVPDDTANEALNASRREITKVEGPSDMVQVSYESFPTRLVSKCLFPNSQTSTAAFDITLSTALHADGEAPCFLAFGYLEGTGRTSLILSNQDSSVIILEQETVLELPSGFDCTATTLVALGASIIASHVLSNSPDYGTIIVHNPTNAVAAAITRTAKLLGRNVLFITATRHTDCEGWTVVHPLAQPRSIRGLIPDDTALTWSFSSSDISNILAVLPGNCRFQRFNPSSISRQRITLLEAYKAAKLDLSSKPPRIFNILDAALSDLTCQRLVNVLDWQHKTPLITVVAPKDPSEVFTNNGTYLLVGMASELGQSLCRFMIRHGARHIVLASRSAANDAKWLCSMRTAGVDICAVKMDVTDSQQVHRTVTMIRNSMPKIAGVTNASLVLEDSLFVNATLEVVEKQLKPKVNGSVILDKEFADDNLDFFILFSSLSCVYGNAGQSIYNAASMFMTTLTKKRRLRGQAASIINLGMIADVGYVARMQRIKENIEHNLRSQFYTPLSEAEFHHLVVQAIVAGHPGSPSGILTIGIQVFTDDPNAYAKPPWYNNPRFSHMIVPFISKNVKAQTSSLQQLLGRLQEADSATEATAAFMELFCKKIGSMMQISAASIDTEAPLSDLGLDSLLAVGIRRWLLSEIGVDVPMLGILGRESPSSIAYKVSQKFAKQDPVTTTPQSVKSSLQNGVVAPMKSTFTLDSLKVEEPLVELIGFPESQTSSALKVSSDDGSLSLGVTTPSDSSSPSELKLSFTGLCQTNNYKTLEIFERGIDEIDVHLSQQYTTTERLSFSQASLHFLHTFLDDPTALNVTIQYNIRGHLNVGGFTRALEKTLARHEAYQTSFFTKPGGPEIHQGVLSSVSIQQRLIHLQSTTNENSEDIFQAFCGHQWDLEKGRLFRAILLTHAMDSHTVIFGAHHIITDGMSWGIFLRDLDHAYRMLPFDRLPYSYLNFTHDQHESLSEDEISNKGVKYWLKELTPLLDVPQLFPFAQRRTRPRQHAYRNNTVERRLDSQFVDMIKKGSRACGATQMHFHLATLQALLACFLNIEAVCIGVTDAGRGGQDHLSDTIGHFTNLLPMRFCMKRDQSFAELLKNTSRVVLNGLDHASIPIDIILEKLGLQRSATSTPLFQIAFNYRVGELIQRPLGNCSMELLQYKDAKTPYDLTVNVTQIADGGQLVEVISNAQLYSTSTTTKILDVYTDFLKILSSDQSRNLHDCLTLHAQAHNEQSLSLSRGPQVQYAWPETLTQRFQQVCTEHPNTVAIKYGADSATYAQLARRAGLIASMLDLKQGINAGSRVLVLCEPSIDAFAAMLGILHIGAVYVPLDPTFPLTRQRAIINACKPDGMIFHSATASATAECNHEGQLPALNLSELDFKQKMTIPTLNPDGGFLLFTSGSTGVPKGICLTQSGIMNYAVSKQAALGLGQIKVLQQSSLAFDMSVAQAFNAFSNAGTLVIAPLQSRGDPQAIANLMAQESIVLTICTPSEYVMLLTYAADLLSQCYSWHHACSGGEVVTDSLIIALQRLELPELVLTDCYGPTEVSCAVTLHSMSVAKGARSSLWLCSVGRPISNTSVYIIGQNDEILPSGFPGEICIGGCGVAKGYLDTTLNTGKFVHDPFDSPEDTSKDRGIMYRTGDKGSLNEDGSLVFLGRMDGDTLVKLRGYRIELEEVARVIRSEATGTIVDVVVTVRGQPEFLVAHVVGAHDTNIYQEQLNELCGHLPLPRYMRPSMIIAIDRLPTTVNGKVDRKAVEKLPLPVVDHTLRNEAEVYLPVAEAEMRRIWRNVLGGAAGTAKIQSQTDFFSVGGSSLLLVRLQNAIQEKMSVRMPLRDLYHASTLRAMAVAAGEERSHVVTDTIDWEAETLIPQHALTKSNQVQISSPRVTQRHVLLTGATGFLGSEILASLISDNSVAKIHCIAVPPNTEHNIALNKKVIIYHGSLSSPMLGLSSSEVASLASSIDQVIHAGAQGHCLNNYMSVRQANYLSTQFLASTLALPRRVPLHFVSSPRVILFQPSSDCSAPPISMASHFPPSDGSQGFTASKWASERFLESLAAKSNLPVVIHRACSIVGASAPPDDAMNSVIRFSLLSRSVPDLPNANGYFDFRDVIGVAREIVNSHQATKLDDKKSTCVFLHHGSGVRVPFDKLAERMETLYSGSFVVVSLAEWIRKAIKLGIEDLIVSYLEANVVGAERLSFPYLADAQ